MHAASFIFNTVISNFSFQHEEENFFALKKKLDDIMKNFRVFDMLINEWNVKWPLVKQRAKYLMKPMDSILEFLGNQIEQR